MTLCLGVDPSLTSTGYAWAPDRTGRFCPSGSVAKGLPRLRWLRDCTAALVEHLLPHGLVMVVMESPAYHRAQGNGWHEQAAGWFYVLDGLSQHEVQVALVNPSHLKMYLTGHGSGAGTDKPAMVAAARDRLGYRGTSNDEADALGLAAMGLDHLGLPLAVLPQAHRRALAGVTWPTVPSVTAHDIARRALGG